MTTPNIPLVPADFAFDDWIDQIGLYLYPIIEIIGILTNILNICVLSRRTILISPCSYYFLVFAVSSLLYICIRCSTQFARLILPLQPFLSNPYCKIEAFLIYFLPIHATLMLVFASIDRFCASSDQKSCRDFSQIYFAKRIIFISTSITIIYFLPFFFVIHWDQLTNNCHEDSTMIIILYLSTCVVILYLLLPIAMIIFGLLTIRNIHRQHNRIIAIVSNPGFLRTRRNESQLARMLVVQVSTYIIFSLPAAVTYPLITFVSSLAESPLMNGVRSIAVLWQLWMFLLSFIIYILSSRTYRKEFLRMFRFNRFCR